LVPSGIRMVPFLCHGFLSNHLALLDTIYDHLGETSMVLDVTVPNHTHAKTYHKVPC